MNFRILALSALTIALSASARLPREEPSQHYIDKSAEYKAAGVKSTDIVFLGNSLTEGGDWAALTGLSNAVNRGIIGDTAEGIDARLSDITSGKPAKIFLLCGVNDISHEIPADSVAMGVIDLVKRIKAESPDTRIYLQSLLPINNTFGRYKRMIGKEDVVRDVNKYLAAKAPELGVTWINLYPLFVDKDRNLRDELTADGLHLRPEGYAIWASIIKPYATE